MDGNTAFALKQMAEVFADAGVEAEILQVGSQAIRGCIGCGSCYKSHKCVFEDLVNETRSLGEAAEQNAAVKAEKEAVSEKEVKKG